MSEEIRIELAGEVGGAIDDRIYVPLPPLIVEDLIKLCKATAAKTLCRFTEQWYERIGGMLLHAYLEWRKKRGYET